MERLGKNIGRYLGELIVLADVLRDIDDAASKHGWRSENFLDNKRLQLKSLYRATKNPRKKVYIATGIHGDEPAGPLAVLELLKENLWPDGFEIWLCPCLNPTGFVRNTRENDQGIDLNREYLRPRAEEIVAHTEWLSRQPRFDLTLLLHEDWESNGFYVYELNPNNLPSLAEEIVEAVAAVCPIDHSELIEGQRAKGGIIRPTAEIFARTDWPEAFFLIKHKTSLSYTLEAPSDFSLPTRVAALRSAVVAAMNACAANPR